MFSRDLKKKCYLSVVACHIKLNLKNLIPKIKNNFFNLQLPKKLTNLSVLYGKHILQLLTQSIPW